VNFETKLNIISLKIKKNQFARKHLENPKKLYVIPIIPIRL